MLDKNKIYYGEYTLKHWIDLILTGNIILPKYQRFFVWDKDNSKALINALRENQFVPPVTIGSYIDDGEKQNLILDGQQRLTSILLAYFNLFPKRDQNKVKAKDFYFASENDDTDDDDIDFINWDFNKLLKLINDNELRDRSEIHNQAIDEGYENMDLTATIDFEKCYLGFSFIVPATEDSKEQQRFYSKVFRSINIEGKKLLPLESREALYYLNKDLAGFFSPDFVKRITINEGKMDFVRYLSILSQYEHTGVEKIARGFSKTMEIYYEKFIYAVVNDEETKEFIKISNKIPELEYNSRIDKLRKIIEKMKLVKQYDSIIDLDLYMFGIIYYTIFENKSIADSKLEELDSNIKAKIEKFKQNELHAKNPSALKHLKLRIEGSIEACKEFVS